MITATYCSQVDTPKFELFRGVHQFIFLGQFSTPEIGPLEQWRPLFEVRSGYWVEHPQYGFVPEFSIHNNGIKDLELTQGFLDMPLGSVSENDIVYANVEHKKIHTPPRKLKHKVKR